MPHANLANDEPMDGVALPGTPAGYAEVLIAEPEPVMDNLKVLAGTWGEAVNWCYAHNLDRPDGRSGHPEFIDDKRMVMGLRNGMYVKIGTYYNRTDCLDIEEELKRRGFTEVEV
jgi:hypothetical protein